MKPSLMPHQFRELANNINREVRTHANSQQLRSKITGVLRKYLDITDEPQARPTRHSVLMDVAFAFAQRGTCCRLKVGAVLAKDGRIVSTGYNGSLPGHAHCTPENCNPNQPCTNTIHAERNLISYALLNGVTDFSRLELYITDSPCINCAKLIGEAGIRKVYYNRAYRIADGLEYLKSIGVEVVCLAR